MFFLPAGNGHSYQQPEVRGLMIRLQNIQYFCISTYFFVGKVGTNRQTCFLAGHTFFTAVRSCRSHETGKMGRRETASKKNGELTRTDDPIPETEE